MKKLFSKPPVLICGSVVLLILCFLMNRYFNTTQVPWPIRSALTTLIIFVSFAGIVKGISQMVTGGKKNTTSSNMDPEHPIRIWTHDELFAYLEKENIIDLDIGHESVKRVGTASDYSRGSLRQKAGFFDKVYYINDQEYSDFAEFKEQFAAAHPEQEVRILRASIDEGSMEVKLP